MSNTPRVLVRAGTHVCTLPAFTPNCCQSVSCEAATRRLFCTAVSWRRHNATGGWCGKRCTPLAPHALVITTFTFLAALLARLALHLRLHSVCYCLPYSAMHAGECTFVLPGNVRTQREEMKCVENLMKLRSITGTS